MNTTSVKQSENRTKNSKKGTRFQRFGRTDEPKPVQIDEAFLIPGRVITFDQVEPEFFGDDSDPVDPIRELVSSSYEQDDDEDRGLPPYKDSVYAGLAALEVIRAEYD